VRVGLPEYVGGFSERVRNPRFATSVGLLLVGLEKHEIDQAARSQGQNLGQVMERMKSWFKQNF
jgi:cell division protein FtsA